MGWSTRPHTPAFDVKILGKAGTQYAESATTKGRDQIFQMRRPKRDCPELVDVQVGRNIRLDAVSLNRAEADGEPDNLWALKS